MGEGITRFSKQPVGEAKVANYHLLKELLNHTDDKEEEVGGRERTAGA